DPRWATTLWESARADRRRGQAVHVTAADSQTTGAKDDSDDGVFTGFTPHDLGLPADLVERITQVATLLGLPVAKRSAMPGITLGRTDSPVPLPGEPADHVTVTWTATDRLLDAAEAEHRIPGPAQQLYGSITQLEGAIAHALVRGGLDVKRDPVSGFW